MRKVKGSTRKKYWINQKSLIREDVEWNWREGGLEVTASPCKAAKLLGKLGIALQWNEFPSEFILSCCTEPIQIALYVILLFISYENKLKRAVNIDDL